MTRWYWFTRALWTAGCGTTSGTPSRRYRVIRFDMRGYGKSEPAQGPVSCRHDLYRLLQELNVERATFLGCSMGGEAIIDLALEHPEMVSALIVVSTSPSGFEFQGEPPPALKEMMKAAQQGDVENTSEPQIRLWVDGPFRQHAITLTLFPRVPLPATEPVMILGS